MSERSTKLRCAVYTRKSHEEGLDQAFSSLDAQREACEAYIASQAGLGWRLVKDRYDDGGLSGGTMERPALQRLLDEVRQGRVDVIVVYKIDRLTRSLMDFARMVEIFDRAKVSFVSVTQQFNTTTSMGRLTLNVLLSFAQFEREVTAERIRDKIAASKRKGMWMGGTVPLGYRAVDRKLVIEPKAAIAVRHLFERYLQLGSVPRLAAELNAERDRRTITPLTAADQLSSGDEAARGRDVASSGVSDVHQALDAGTTAALLLTADTGQGRRRPSVRIGSGKLYYILSNPIYVGRVRHGETLHAGEHNAIVTQDLFNAVQAKLTEQTQRPRGSSSQPDVHLLAGLIIDGAGDPCRPTHATKGGKRYRYYVSKALLKTTDADRSSGLRLPAHEIEILVISELCRLLGDPALLTRWLETARQDGSVEVALRRATQLREELADAKATDRLRRLLAAMIDRVTVSSIRVELSVDRRGLIGLLLASDGSRPASIRAGKAARSLNSKAVPETGSLADRAAGDDRASPSDIDLDGPKAKTPSAADTSNLHTISLPLSIRRRGFERRLVIVGQEAASARPDRPLIEMIARAHLYLRATTAEGLDRRQVAQRYGTRAEDVGRILPLAFLSPRITDAILTGRQPSDLSVIRMTRQTDLPLAWTQQSDELGF